MDLDTAMGVLARSAGDDLAEFMGQSRIRVSQEAVREAGQAFAQELLATTMSGDERLRTEDGISAVIGEFKAEALEAWWAVYAAGPLVNPGKRAQLQSWIEDRTGRPIPAAGA
jgi:predicted transcriptional regulator